MKAILLYEPGGVDKFVYGDIEEPKPKTGEVLVNIKAIGINPADAGIRQVDAMIDHWVGHERPAILGWDISGEIVEKANNTAGFEIGDSVFSLLPTGKAYAEYVAVPVTALAHKPGNISYIEAAAVPIAAVTAWNPLVRNGQIKPGDRVLIHAGAGGVGHFAVQIAKHFGAYVVATSSAKNRDFVLSLGADEHIDYTAQKFYEILSDIDFVLDTIGGDTLNHSIDIVKDNGMIITVIPGFSDEIKQKAEKRNIHLSFGGVEESNDLTSIADLLTKGILKVHIAATYPFAQMAEAHTRVATGHTVGKIVVSV